LHFALHLNLHATYYIHHDETHDVAQGNLHASTRVKGVGFGFGRILKKPHRQNNCILKIQSTKLLIIILPKRNPA